MLLLIFYILL